MPMSLQEALLQRVAALEEDRRLREEEQAAAAAAFSASAEGLAIRLAAAERALCATTGELLAGELDLCVSLVPWRFTAVRDPKPQGWLGFDASWGPLLCAR